MWSFVSQCGHLRGVPQWHMSIAKGRAETPIMTEMDVAALPPGAFVFHPLENHAWALDERCSAPGARIALLRDADGLYKSIGMTRRGLVVAGHRGQQGVPCDPLDNSIFGDTSDELENAEEPTAEGAGAEPPVVAAGRVPAKFCGLRSGNTDLFAETADAADWELAASRDEVTLVGLLAGLADVRPDATLLRALRARQGDVTRAAQLLESMRVWRDENGLQHGFMNGSLDDTLHRRFDPYLRPFTLLGLDKDGDPVLYERPACVSAKDIAALPRELLLRHEVYTLTRLQQALAESSGSGRPKQFLVILDAKGLSRDYLDASVLQTWHQCARIAQDNYPELLKRVFVVHASWAVSSLWAVGQHFLDPGTQAKVEIVRRAQTGAVLQQYMDARIVPAVLGGTGQFTLPAPARIPAGLVDEASRAAEAFTSDLAQQVITPPSPTRSAGSRGAGSSPGAALASSPARGGARRSSFGLGID